MRHPSTQAVYEYWNRRRGNQPAPERSDIDPSEIRYALGDAFMLAADFIDELRFRLAGTRVCALFCREIKGETFAEIWDAESRTAVTELMTAVEQDKVAAVAGLVGRTEADNETELELLVLPLAHSGQARIRALGVLAPSAPPYWLGAQPLAGLELATLRYIGQEPVGRAAPRFGATSDGNRVRHGFVVYSGGRESQPGKRTG
jgi:hypothetical protein